MTHIHGEFLNNSKRKDKATRANAQARYCVENENEIKHSTNETKCEARETK